MAGMLFPSLLLTFPIVAPLKEQYLAGCITYKAQALCNSWGLFCMLPRLEILLPACKAKQSNPSLRGNNSSGKWETRTLCCICCSVLSDDTELVQHSWPHLKSFCLNSTVRSPGKGVHVQLLPNPILFFSRKHSPLHPPAVEVGWMWHVLGEESITRLILAAGSVFFCHPDNTLMFRLSPFQQFV